MKIVKIEKCAGQKITVGYNSWNYETRLEALVEIEDNDSETLEKESEKLYAFARRLKDLDIDKNWKEMYPDIKESKDVVKGS